MIRIEFETENDAFDPDNPDGWRQETARLLRHIADDILQGQSLPFTLRDINGNRVGKVEQDPLEIISAPAGKREA